MFTSPWSTLRAVLWLGFVLSLNGCVVTPNQKPPVAENADSVTLLHINDVYRIAGVNQGRDGSLARVRALRSQLETSRGPVLLTHGGDFLFPSLLSREYDGAQMVDMMNQLDGAAGSLDPHMYVVFGNHEFDKDALDEAHVLQSRLDESEFQWLDTNISWLMNARGAPAITGNRIKEKIIEVDGIRVGLFGITTKKVIPAYADINSDYTRVAAASSSRLRAQGAEIVVAITHLKAVEDSEILRTLGAKGPDLILGGHDHQRMEINIDGRHVLKAEADARSAVIARFTRRGDGGFDFDYNIQPLDQSIAPDDVLTLRSADWQQRFNKAHCDSKNLDANCLDQRLGQTAVDLIAEEQAIRKYETNVGNFLTDLARDAFLDQGADIALLNAGSMRINQDISAGTTLTERHIVELFPYPTGLKLFRITGRELQAAINHSIEDWTGNGWWLQVSGLGFEHDPVSGLASKLTLLDGGEQRTIDPNQELLAVTSEYLLNPRYGQDGYHMFNPDTIIDTGKSEPKLADLFRQAITLAGNKGIAPAFEGRICNTLHKEKPCLLDSVEADSGEN